MKSGEGFDNARENSKKKNEGTATNEDQRRNLYVLGIPHHMTLDELKKLFGQFGQVQHAVILAVLDAFRRRRGFIVMNSNVEAAAAMKGMSGAVVQNHKFHVSWAVVQRSNGFLDGVDRTSGPTLGSPPSPDWSTSANPEPSYPASRFERPRHIKLPPVLSIPTSHTHSSRSRGIQKSSQHPYSPSSIILHNLHRDIFKSPADILPLLEPFGVVKRIRILDQRQQDDQDHHGPDALNDPTPRTKTVELPAVEASADESGGEDKTTPAEKLACMSASVDFGKYSEALAAREGLDGQAYGSMEIRVEMGGRGSEAVVSGPSSGTPDDEEEEDEDGEEHYYPFRDVPEDDALVHRYASRMQTKKRCGAGYFAPSVPSSPRGRGFPAGFMGSPTPYGYVHAYNSIPSPWMSAYSSSAPPSPAHLAQFYFAQDPAMYPSHPYAPEASHYFDYRSYPLNPHSQHHYARGYNPHF